MTFRGRDVADQIQDSLDTAILRARKHGHRHAEKQLLRFANKLNAPAGSQDNDRNLLQNIDNTQPGSQRRKDAFRYPMD
jgi:hypothetical protein